MHYYDVHAHHFYAHPQLISIVSLYQDWQRVLEHNCIYSIGIHPWYFNDNWQKEMDVLASFAKDPHVVAIGECGLDKLQPSSIIQQQRIFAAQVQLAVDYHKPLIIHCVRAFTEVLSILRGVSIPVVFHGINNKWSTVEPLVAQGYYLSFGKHASKAIVAHTIQQTPLHQIFVETDDSTGDSIIAHYDLVAAAKNITTASLAESIAQNFKTVFNQH